MHFKRILLIVTLLFCASPLFAQRKKTSGSVSLKEFSRLSTQANIAFTVPEGFKELPSKQNGLTFDYGMGIPGEEFEIWFRVIPDKNETPDDRDSTYLDVGKVEAQSLAGDENYFMRSMPDRVLADYNADAGKTYLINLPDSASTKHYKYALLIMLQKKKGGTVMAVCLTNDKGPDFFRNINRARSCIRFKAI